jgi:hypothetical protein
LSEIVDFFFVDTTPFQKKYWTHPGKHHYDWRGVAPRGKYIANLLKVCAFGTKSSSMLDGLPSFCKQNCFELFCSAMQDLDEAMQKSTAMWKIVVGHHTMRSVSDHGDTKELLKLLLPVLKVIQKLVSKGSWKQSFDENFHPFRKTAPTSTSTGMITASSTLAAETGLASFQLKFPISIFGSRTCMAT